MSTRYELAKSRLSNGSQLLPHVDGRSTWARRYRDLIQAHLDDMGGVDACSEAERSIIKRAAALTVELERLEAQFAAAGEQGPSPEALDLHSRMSGNLRRLLESTGIRRQQKDVTPDLGDYLAAKGSSK